MSLIMAQHGRTRRRCVCVMCDWHEILDKNTLLTSLPPSILLSVAKSTELGYFNAECMTLAPIFTQPTAFAKSPTNA